VPFSIRDEEACRLARELAELLGVTPEEAIHIAVKARLERLKSAAPSESHRPEPREPPE
jgi:hypothetical protein